MRAQESWNSDLVIHGWFWYPAFFLDLTEEIEWKDTAADQMCQNTGFCTTYTQSSILYYDTCSINTRTLDQIYEILQMRCSIGNSSSICTSCNRRQTHSGQGNRRGPTVQACTALIQTDHRPCRSSPRNVVGTRLSDPRCYASRSCLAQAVGGKSP